jgi:anti-anti-sigma regulatory factor
VIQTMQTLGHNRLASVILIPGPGSGSNRRDVNKGVRKRELLRELDSAIKSVVRPRLVLDCSELEHVGIYEIGLLMECLERVMVRNGDAKLAEVSSRVKGILVSIGADRVFKMYDTREAAISSYASSHEMAGYSEDVADRGKLQYREERSAYPSSTLR